MKLLSSAEKKKILKKLTEQYGIKTLPYLLLRFGKEKIRAYSGSLTKQELKTLDKNLRVENTGLYLGKEHHNEFRLSLDAIHVLKNQITKNILELDTKQVETWFSGKDIELPKPIPPGFVVLKHKENLIGCGKATNSGIIKNYMPKERRIKG